METITGDMIINDVIKKYPATVKTFSEFKVDSCCGGGQSIATTASLGGTNIPKLIDALNKAVNGDS